MEMRDEAGLHVGCASILCFGANESKHPRISSRQSIDWPREAGRYGNGGVAFRCAKTCFAF